MKRTLANFAATIAAAACQGATIVVPENAAGVEGLSNLNAGYWLQGRVQHVINQSDFTGLGPIEISSVAFKSDAIFRPNINVIFPNLSIFASTTQASAQGLSPRYSDNIGPDMAVVFSGAYSLIARGSPGDFATEFVFETGFVYNPLAGNLLLEFVFVGVPIGFISESSAFDRIGSSEGADTDSASALRSNDPFAVSTNNLPTDPPTLRLTYVAVPEPRIAVFALVALLALAGRARRH